MPPMYRAVQAALLPDWLFLNRAGDWAYAEKTTTHETSWEAAHLSREATMPRIEGSLASGVLE